MKLGPKLAAYWRQSLDPSWFIPFLGYFDLTKSVSILSFHRRNQLFVKYLRYRQQATVGGRFPWNYSHVRSQRNPEVLVFYVIKGLSLAAKVVNQFWFFDKS